MNNKIISGFFWRLAERFGAQGVTFIVSLILARLLDPETYGTVALITVFTTILQVFVDSGLGTALVQKKNADDTDFSTVFFFNVAMCAAVYILLFACAPLIAAYYENMELVPLVRTAGVIILISGVKNIQQAYVSKNLLFKRFFFATLGGTLGAAVLGIAMAYKGFGAWALIAQMLFNAAVDTVILWITVKWRPKAVFSFERLRGLFSFGWKLLVSGLLDTVYNNLRSLIIGKLYTADDLAFYNKGDQFPMLLVSNINTSIDSILLPVMSASQDSKENVRDMTRRAITVSTYILMPMMAGLAACAQPLVRLLLTEKWLPCVPYLRIFCFSYAFYPIHTANLNAIKAMGRSDLFLRLEIIKKLVGLTVLILTMRHGVLVMAFGLLAVSVISQIINSWPNKTILSYSYLEQIRDILPALLLSAVMCLIVFLITRLPFSDIVTLILQVISGAVFYAVFSYLFKIESFFYLIGKLKKIKNR